MKKPLILRKANISDIIQIRFWRNNKDSRKNSFNKNCSSNSKNSFQKSGASIFNL